MEKMRRGKFKIPYRMIDQSPDMLRALMSHMIVVRAESLYFNNEVEYHAISPLFDVIELGQMVPQYLIEANQTETGYEFCAKRL
jgi:hypothetical protein